MRELEVPGRGWGLIEKVYERAVAASSEALSDLVGKGRASCKRTGGGVVLPNAANGKALTVGASLVTLSPFNCI